MTATYPTNEAHRSHPLNRAASRWLPSDWRSGLEMPILTLMRWGLAEVLTIIPTAPNHPDQEQIETMINRLARHKPAKVLAFLIDPERIGNGQTVLDETDLDRMNSSLDAAALLLQTLCNSMIVTDL